MTRVLSAKEFSAACNVEIPKKMDANVRVVYFDVCSQLHEAISVETPVDTGYLRATLMAAPAGETPGVELPKRTGKERAGAYAALRGRADSRAAMGIAVGVKRLVPIAIGFLANYAPFVEDRRHMIKQARARLAQIIRTAIRNAGGGA